MLGCLLARVVVLAEGDTRSLSLLLELVEKRVVVLWTILFAAQRTEMRHFQPPRLLDLDDFPFVFVLLALVLAFPDDRAPRLPVGDDVRAEHVLLDLLRIRERGPDLAR